MITLNVERAYYNVNKPVISGFGMHVTRGETVAIVGPSGIGKSTLLKIIAGLHKDFTGRLDIVGDLRIAFMPQSQSLLPWKTVYENTVLLAKAEKRRIDTGKAQRLIAALGLSGFEKRYPLSLSGGQYRRVALGQAFFYEPDLILMDEPFTGLDGAIKKEVMDLFMRLREETGITTVFVTHDGWETEYLGSRVIAL